MRVKVLCSQERVLDLHGCYSCAASHYLSFIDKGKLMIKGSKLWGQRMDKWTQNRAQRGGKGSENKLILAPTRDANRRPIICLVNRQWLILIDVANA